MRLDIRNRREYESALADATDCIAYEDLLQRAYAHVDQWLLPAICQACGNAVGLLADKQHNIQGLVNFRERLTCPVCQLNTRQRFIASLVREIVRGLGRRPQIYLYEQVTPFFQWAQGLDADVVGSEYLGYEIPGGAAIDGIRHEDAMALSFGDATLDVIVSQDVMEQIPEIDPALREAARVLRAGGRLLFSVPFDPSADVTVKRAELHDVDVDRLMEPVVRASGLHQDVDVRAGVDVGAASAVAPSTRASISGGSPSVAGSASR